MSDSRFRPVFNKTRPVLIILVLALIYGYGWKVTEIKPGVLFRDAESIQPLLKALLKPDLLKPNIESSSIEALFQLSEATFIERPAPGSATSPTLWTSKTGGRKGDALTVRGLGLRPDTKGQLFWINEIEQEILLGAFETDASGKFHMSITVPPIALGVEQRIRADLISRTGGWHFSPTARLTAEKMVETLFLALMATTMAVFVAIPLSVLGARNLMSGDPVSRCVYYLIRTVFNVLRSIEPLILAILFAVWVGIGPFAGVLALGLHSIAALGKLYSEQIENIDPGPVEAITATGATRLQVILYGVAPQVIPPFLAFTFYRWDINVRMSTIVGFVGGGGIGFLLQQWINLLQYDKAGVALLAIGLVVITLDTLSGKIREKLV